MLLYDHYYMNYHYVNVKIYFKMIIVVKIINMNKKKTSCIFLAKIIGLSRWRILLRRLGNNAANS